MVSLDPASVNEFLLSSASRTVDEDDSDTESPPSSPGRKKRDKELPLHAQRFIKDFRSLIWFTYRKDFERIPPYNVTNDVGWGCML